MTREDVRMGRALASMAGQAEDVTRDPSFGLPDPFLAPSGGYGQRPMSPYEVVEDPGIAPGNTNFAPPVVNGHGLVQPENFRAPMPGAKRMGNGYVLKAAFGDVVFGPEPVEKAEKVQDVDWTVLIGPSSRRDKLR
jgi:hypothetical protein